MSSNKTLVPTTKKMVKEVIRNTETDKQQAYQTKINKSKSNESNKKMALNKSSSLDYSRASEGTETKHILKQLNKRRLMLSASLSDKNTKINNQKK